MAQTIKIRRSTTTASPSTLENGELAYSSNSNKLFIGRPGGTTGDIDAIGGKFFTDLLDHTAGTLTASSAILVDSNSKIDVINVDNLRLDGNVLSSTNTNGNIEITPNASGSVVLDGTNWPQADGTAGQYLQTDGLGQLSWNTVVSDFTISDGSTTDSFSTGQTLTFTGVNNITTTVSDNEVTFTGLSDSEIRGLVSAAGDLSYNSTTGEFSVTTYKSADFDTDFSGKTTADLTESGNLYYTDARARQSINVTDVSGYGSLAYNNTTGVITYTGPSASEVYADFSASGGLTFALGNYSITDGGVTNAKLANSSLTIGSTNVALGATSTTLTGVTQLDVDNITINGNEISSTDTNGDITLNPNGTGTVDVSNSRITDLAAPINATDATNKAYVDNAITGLAFKAAVNLLADSNIALTGTASTLVIDSHDVLVAADSGYRILLTGQSTDSENGIYVYDDNGSTYTLSRPTDADAYDELHGASVLVLEGTIYGNTGWVQENYAITDFTGQNWVQFSGAGAFIAGDGLSQNGTEFSVNVAATGGIEIVADELKLADSVAGDGLTITSGVINAVGTTDRISVSANAIDISTSYVGQASITTLGTITTGTWNGSVIGAAYGGTSHSSYARGDILYASAANTLSKLNVGSAGQVLASDGTDVAWADLDGGTF